MKVKITFGIYIGFRIKKAGTYRWWTFNLFGVSVSDRTLTILTWRQEGSPHQGLFLIIIPGPETANKFTLLLFGKRFGGGLNEPRN